MARLNIISFESDFRMSIYPDLDDKKLGLYTFVEKFLICPNLFGNWIRF